MAGCVAHAQSPLSASTAESSARRAQSFLSSRSLNAQAQAAQADVTSGTGTTVSVRAHTAAASEETDSLAVAQQTAATMLAAARVSAQAMDTLAASSTWAPLGPAQTNSSLYGKVTGRVTSIAIDPSDSSGNHVYVGTTGGGVWKSVNAAASLAANVSFTPLTDTLYASNGAAMTSLSIGALTVQPGGTGVVLAGTGDPNDALDSYYGAGILRSTDNGVTWSLIAQSSDASYTPASNHSFAGEGFAGFAWSTSNTSLVVAALSQAVEGLVVNAVDNGNSAKGLYYSTDAGAHWRMATITDGTGKIVQRASTSFTLTDGNAATAVVWNPVRKRFYAAVRYHGVYESSDGATFTRLTSQPGTNLTTTKCPTNQNLSGSESCPFFRAALAVQATTGDLFVLSADSSNLDQGLWRDTCQLAGSSCTSSTVSFTQQVATDALHSSTSDTTLAYANYNLWLAAVPSQQDTILYAGTQDLYRCSLANSCAWRNTTNANTCASAAVAPAQHAGAFFSDSLGFFGNDGGLWRTTDGVAQTGGACSVSDADHFDNLNGSLGSLGEVVSVAGSSSDAGVVLAGQAVQGVTATSVATANTAWPQLLDGEGGNVAIDRDGGDVWYANSGTGVSIYACSRGNSCSGDGFGLLPQVGNTQVGGDNAGVGLPAPFLQDAADPDQLLIGTCRVWRGPASGAGWSQANAVSGMLDGDQQSACNGNGLVRSLAAASVSGGGQMVYVGMAGVMDGGLNAAGKAYSAQMGADGTFSAWTDITSAALENDTTHTFNQNGYAVSSLAVDPHDTSGKTVYATVAAFSGSGLYMPHVYRSLNGGATWSNLSANLPNAPANAVLVDPSDANTVYVAMDTGVYATSNITSCLTPTNNCWNQMGSGLPGAPVTALSTYSSGSGGYLRAATYGRGIWQIALAGAASSSATLLPSSLDFGSQTVQTTGAQQMLSLRNTGDIALSIAQVTVTGDFTQTNTCEQASLDPDASCTLTVTFTPTAAGARNGLVTVYTNVDGGQLTASLSGTGVAGGSLVLLPGSLDFGALPLGTTSAVQNVTISNVGASAVTLGSFSIIGDFAIRANTCKASLEPDYGCTVSVTFTPTASGTRTGTLTLPNSQSTQTVSLMGSGQTDATDTLSPLSLAFPATVAGAISAPQLVTMTNTGDISLTSISAAVTGDFTVSSNCGGSLAGHASCSFALTFHPSTLGSAIGVLTITDQFRSQSIPVSGVGNAPAGFSVTPAQIAFSYVGVGQTSGVRTVTVTNNSTLGVSGLSFNLPSANFALTANSCGTSLMAGASCTLGVTYRPSAIGAEQAVLTVTNNTYPSATVGLSGTGSDFSFAVSGVSTATTTSGSTATYNFVLTPLGASTGTATFSCAGAPSNTTCTMNPTSSNFGNGTTVTVQMAVATGQAGSTSGTTLRPVAAAAGFSGLFCLLLALGPAGLAQRRVCGRSARLLLLALAACLLAGCGVSVKSSDASSPGNSGGSTPAGSYTLRVSASGMGLTRTASVQLIVE